ncbi:MAG: hypothetical protein L0Y79_07335 [Chlorobi bacterium]|nr:hypothetical protein [Chlorobiota bacterium]MCI0715988.1 hypothetical protein [Chlorobiota bacterium]
MENTLKVINELQNEGLIKNYAIGGAIASIFYIEPITTYDLDVMIILEEDDKSLISLSPIYSWLSKKGYKTEKEHVIIEGIPVQFLPVYNELIKDAVINSEEKKYKDIITYVIKPEYQIAIMLDTYRAKDRERITRFLEEAELDLNYLDNILSKYKLKEKFKNLKK